MKNFEIRIQNALPVALVIEGTSFTDFDYFFREVTGLPDHVREQGAEIAKAELGYVSGWTNLVGKESNRALPNHAFWTGEDEVKIAIERIQRAIQVGEGAARETLASLLPDGDYFVEAPVVKKRR